MPLQFFTRQIQSVPLRLIQAVSGWPNWRMGLLEDSQRPEKQLYTDDLIVILADHKPKARYHYLVLPKTPINDVRDLRSSHIPLLRHMIDRSHFFINQRIKPHTRNPVRMGFHVVPTYLQLHLHLISEDFDSRFMSSRFAYGSFTTDFLMPPEKAISLLEERGRIDIDPAEATEIRGDYRREMFCHGCSMSFFDMPNLKAHIVVHDLDRLSVNTSTELT